MNGCDMIRLMDIILSAIAILVLSPVLLFVAIILSVTGEREIFFIQKRRGIGNTEIPIVKFATMLKDSPRIGTETITIKNDPRILPVGKFLRKTKINELPQIFNIFWGHISVIGPRPLTSQNFDLYTDNAKKIISSVKPGLSGVGSIVFRNEEDLLHGKDASIAFYREIVAPYKAALELWYIENKGVTLYLTLIFATVWTVVFPRSSFIWRLFKDIPRPPAVLKEKLNLK